MLRVIVRTFLTVFPRGSAFLAHYSLESPILGLVASTGPDSLRYPGDWLRQRVVDSKLSEKLSLIRLDNRYELFGCFVACNKGLTAFAGKEPLNTDDDPIVTFGAPRFIYGKKQPACGRLFELLHGFHPRPEDIIADPVSEEDRQFQLRLASYWGARNEFLMAGVGVPRTNDPEELLKSVREPLLAVVRTSPDFMAAYKPLLAIAYSLSRTDPRASEELLRDLEKANPEYDEARRLRLRLCAEGSLASRDHN